jgi:hypothetical protein
MVRDLKIDGKGSMMWNYHEEGQGAFNWWKCQKLRRKQ